MPQDGNKLKFLDNLPETVIFKYDSPKVWDNVSKQDGKSYKTYSYAVTYKGIDLYMSANEYLNSLLQSLGSLQGRELELVHLQDPSDLKRKYWQIKERGADITPSVSSQPKQTVQNNSELEDRVRVLEERIEKMANWARGIEQKVSAHGTLLVDLRGKETTELHESFPKHNDDIPTIPE